MAESYASPIVHFAKTTSNGLVKMVDSKVDSMLSSIPYKQNDELLASYVGRLTELDVFE